VAERLAKVVRRHVKTGTGPTALAAWVPLGPQESGANKGRPQKKKPGTITAKGGQYRVSGTKRG